MRRKRKKQINRTGFTLVELLVVIVILAMLSGIVAPKLVGQIAKAKFQACRPKMASVESAIDTFVLNTGVYPDTLDDLIFCPSGYEELWEGPYLKEKQLLDTWDRPFYYDPYQGNPYLLISYGADGQEGGTGYDTDIYND